MSKDQERVQRLTTEDIPRYERLGFVHDFIGRHIGGINLNPRDSEDVRIDLEAMQFPGGLTIGRGRFSPLRGVRTRNLLQDGRSHYLLTIHYEDYEVSADGKAPIKVTAGDVTVMDEAVCSEFWFGRTMAVDAVALDRRLLAGLVPRLDNEAVYVLPGMAPDMRLLTSYVDTVRAWLPSSEKARGLAARHIHDLAALVLDGAVSGGGERNERSVAAARLKVAQRDILERLSDHGLHVDAVARRQGVTARYIQRLFEIEGTTFSDFVRERRLDLALRLLKDRERATTITDIAYDAGFADISSFNRAFRRRFGATPSEIRATNLIG